MLPLIFCIMHLNWILKTADLTESLGRLDERPVNNGETDGVNPRSRQCGRLADKPRENDRENLQTTTETAMCHVLSNHMDACTLASGHFTCGSGFNYICHAYILSLTAKSGESAMITIKLLLSGINRQAGASVEEGFKCLFT